jgi:NTE family protein
MHAKELAVQVFGIFEGGGAKGLAHVGAIAAAQQLGVKFAGVAGASAGAIVASLIAVGYKAKELYDPSGRTGLMSGNLTDLFGQGKWEEWKQFSEALQNKFSGANAWGMWTGAPSFYWNWKTPIRRLMTELGFLDTAPLETAIDTWLRGGKIKIPGTQERLLFSDLDPTKVPPLRIISSDIDGQAPIVFSLEKTPEMPVARAVCASIAIPFFFQPVTLEVDGIRRTLVDGGLVSNFPVWIFDDLRRKSSTPTATIGFRLSEVTATPVDSQSSPIRFARQLLETALNANIDIHARGIDDLYTIRIDVDASTYDFDLTADRKYAIYQSARQQAGFLFLRDVAPHSPAVLKQMLKEAADLFAKASGFTGHLRANLVLPTSRGTLRIVTGYNMDHDADDRLEFEIESSACGECWTKQKVIVFDIGAYLKAKTPIPGLNKYQQALVRSSLSSIISIPIFDQVADDAAPSGVSKPLIGILNLDSDSATVVEFEATHDAAHRAALTCAGILQAQLSP